GSCRAPFLRHGEIRSLVRDERQDWMKEVAEPDEPLAHAARCSRLQYASWPLGLVALTVAMLLVLVATGWFAGAVTRDTPSYRVALPRPHPRSEEARGGE